MLRTRTAVVAACALALSVAGCSGVPETVGTAIDLPGMPTDPQASESPSPMAEAPASSVPEEGVPEPTGTAAEPAAATTEDCVIVAAGVSSILLAPLSFMGVADEENVERLHDQIDDLRAMVPETLVDDFDRLQDVVTTGTDGGGSFDEASYRAAVEPIEDWLHQHCDKPTG